MLVMPVLRVEQSSLDLKTILYTHEAKSLSCTNPRGKSHPIALSGTPTPIWQKLQAEAYEVMCMLVLSQGAC